MNSTRGSHHLPIRAGSLLFLFAIMFSTGCPASKPLPLEAPIPTGPPPSLLTLRPAARVACTDLRTLSCDTLACARVEGRRWIPFDARTLAPKPGSLELPMDAERLIPQDDGFRILGRCGASPCALDLRESQVLPLVPAPQAETATPPLPPPEPATPASQAQSRSRSWNRLIQEKWRIPFQKQVPAPGGGVITYLRGAEVDSALLMRAGGGLRQARAQGSGGLLSCDAWMALHPTGQELYLLPWPSSRLSAHDPQNLSERWSLSLDSPAVGLFLDSAGRFAILGRTTPPETGRLLDYTVENPDNQGAEDPNADGRLDLSSRPPIVETLLIDLSRQELVTSARGAFRAWLPRPGGGMILAASEEIVALDPP